MSVNLFYRLPAIGFLLGMTLGLAHLAYGQTEPLPSFQPLVTIESDAFIPMASETSIADKAESQPADSSEATSDANAASPDYETLLKRIEELEAGEAKRKESDAKKKADEEKKKKQETDKADDWIDMSGDKWNVKLGGHVQLEYINWVDADEAIPDTRDYVQFRRLRLVADGTGYGVYDFRLQMTLEPETVGASPPGQVTTPDVKDAYFTINEIPGLGRFRIGNFFVPFSLEQVTNDTNNIFLERSIPSQGIFAADREVGIALYNCTEDERITWATGAFFDSVSEGLKERIDDNQGLRLSGRLTWLPYYDAASNGRYLVHTGVGILSTQDQDNRVRFQARPQIHEGPRIIDSGFLNADSYDTGNMEFAWVWGPVTLQSEAFASVVNFNSGASETVHGGYAHLSYFFTGENRIFDPFGQHGAQFGRNVPYTNVFATPGGIGWGAWEAKIRYSNLDLTSVNRGVYDDITAGFNWYWSDRVRIMFDWIHPFTSEDAIFGETSSDILATRFDFNW